MEKYILAAYSLIVIVLGIGTYDLGFERGRNTNEQLIEELQLQMDIMKPPHTARKKKKKVVVVSEVSV